MEVPEAEMDSSSDVALYSGLAAGVVTVVVLIVVVALYRRSQSEYGVDVIDSSALTGGFQSFSFKSTRQGNPLLMNSSLQTDLAMSRAYVSPMCFSHTLHKEPISEQSLFPPLPDVKVKVHSSFMVSLGMAQRAEFRHQAPPQTFPRGLNQDLGVRGATLDPRLGLVSGRDRPLLKASTLFGHGGGRLVVPNTGVSLLVPPGAMAEDTSWEIYMSINQEETCVLSDTREILLGPEVTYGPPGLDLSCPVAMTIAHCADGNSDDWSVKLRRWTRGNCWEDVMSVEEENSSCYCLLESHCCHLLVDRPGCYALVGEPLSEDAGKRLRIVAFGALQANAHQADTPQVDALTYSLRVYCVDDTPHALQELLWSECGQGGRLLDEPKVLLFRRNSFSLQISIQDIPPFLWSIKPFTTCQEFSFSQVWCSSKSALMCAFTLERYSPSANQLSCKIIARQVKGQEQVLQVFTTLAEGQKDLSLAQSDCTITSETGARAFKIPPSIRQRICATFDTANAKGKDWQLLAQHLHIDQNLGYFAWQPSPSAAILCLWEALHQGRGDLDSLASALEEIGRAHSRQVGGAYHLDPTTSPDHADGPANECGGSAHPKHIALTLCHSKQPPDTGSLDITKAPPSLDITKAPPSLDMTKAPPSLDITKTPPSLDITKAPPSLNQAKQPLKRLDKSSEFLTLERCNKPHLCVTAQGFSETPGGSVTPDLLKPPATSATLNITKAPPSIAPLGHYSDDLDSDHT